MSQHGGEKERTGTCPACKGRIPALSDVCNSCGAFLNVINNNSTHEHKKGFSLEDMNDRILQAVEHNYVGIEYEDTNLLSDELVEEEYACPECGNRVDLETAECPHCGVQFSDIEEIPDTFMEAVLGQLEQILEKTIADLEIDTAQHKDFPTASLSVEDDDVLGETEVMDPDFQGENHMKELSMTNGTSPKKGGVAEGMTSGLTNGLANGITNGVTNGLRALMVGITNGVTNGNGITNGLRARQGTVERRRSKIKVAVVPAIILFLVFSPYILLNFNHPDEGISVDGGFGDWTNVHMTTDTVESPTFNPNVDIIDYSIEDKMVALSFYLEVSGQIFAGEPTGQRHVDAVQILVDLDQNPESGYYVRGIGADYMVEVYGWGNEILSSNLFGFTSEEQDWNLWDRIGAIPSANSGSALEVKIHHSAVYKRNRDPVDVLFHTQSWDRFEDFSDTVISSEKGVLCVKQEGVGGDVVEGNDNRMLRLILTAINSDVTTSELRISRLGRGLDSDVKAIRLEDTNGKAIASGSLNQNTATFKFDLPLSEKETSILFVVVDIARNAEAENSIGFKIQNFHDIVTDTGTINVECIYSNSTHNDVSYIKKIPNNIVLDGAFADWNGNDLIDDTTGDVANPNLDIIRYGMKNDTEMAWFYMRVDGELAGGIHIPYWNDEVKSHANEYSESNSRPYQHLPRELAPKTGEDYAYIFVDSLQGSGYMISNGAMCADFMVLIRGRHNEITASSFYVWTGENPHDWSWEEKGNIVVEIDTVQMETGIEIHKLGIERGNHNVSVFFQTYDWEKSNSDDSDEIASVRSDTPIRGTRSPPGAGWPSDWTSLGTDPNDAGIEDNDDILETYANDSDEILFLRMDIEILSPEPRDCYDFYFNSSDNVWYRIRLNRNPQNTAWIFDQDNTTSPTPPTDDSIWWNEKTNTVSADRYDGADYGYNFNNNNSEGIANSILVWVKKDSLSQGYDLLIGGNTTHIFSDTHDNGDAQNKQKDRAPDDTGDPDPTYSYSSVGVPEFSDIFLPVTGLFALIAIFRRRWGKVLRQGHIQMNIKEERQ